MIKRFARRLVLTVLPICAVMFFVPEAIAATVTVNTSADEFGTGSGCSLREAIKSVDGVNGSAATGSDFGGCLASGSYAAGAGPPDTIMVPAGTYQLDLSGSPEDNDASGDLDVFRSMNLVGTGNPTIQQTVANSRVLDVTATGKKLSLSGLTITGGDQAASDGGGIHFRGGSGSASLSFNHVTVTGNDASGNGAGIFTDSPTTITDSVITDNHTVVTTGPSGHGGGIYQDGSTDSLTGVSLVLDHSSVTGNSGGDATNFGSGGGVYRITKPSDGTSNATIQDSDVSNNKTHFFGGGIYSESDATLDVAGSLVSDNQTLDSGTGKGGGISLNPATPVPATPPAANLVDTTVTGNQAVGSGGGINAGNGGIVSLSLLFSTIADNSGFMGGTELFYSGSSSPKPSYTIEGTIIASTVPSSACRLPGSDFVNRTDGGYNISTDPTDATPHDMAGPGCGLTAPLANGDRTGESGPVVNALADNGGPTKTMEPTAAGFAVDNMPNSVCSAISPAVTTDQRGFARPEVNGGNCDSGAYEVQPPVLTAIGNKTVQSGQLLTFTTSASDLDPGDTLAYSATNLPAGASFNAGTRTFSWTPTAAQAGTFPNVRFSVSDGFSSDAEDIAISVTIPPPAGTGTGPGQTTAPPAKKKCKKHKKRSAAAAKKCKKKRK